MSKVKSKKNYLRHVGMMKANFHDINTKCVYKLIRKRYGMQYKRAMV